MRTLVILTLLFSFSLTAIGQTTQSQPKPQKKARSKKRSQPALSFSHPTGSGKTVYDATKAQDVRTEEFVVTKKLSFTKRVRNFYANIVIEYRTRRKRKVGTLRIKLYHLRAPRTVENFIGLAEGNIEFSSKNEKNETVMAKKPFYDGLSFHRIIKKFIAQAGSPSTKNKAAGPGYSIPLEFNSRLIHDRLGVVSMARSGGKSHGSQFFITLAPIPRLNKVNSVFGQVISGVNVLQDFEKIQTDREDVPKIPIKIRSIKIERTY